MATRAEQITIIEGQVTKVLVSSVENTKLTKIVQVEATGGTLEQHGINVLVSGQNGSYRELQQLIRVEYDSKGVEVEAWLEAPILKDHVESTPQADLLTKLTAIETEVGGEVKIDTSSLDALGVSYLVYESGGVKKVAVTLDGEATIKEAI